MGHVLGHVRDLDYDTRDPNVRTYQTTERQYYHSDSCDIVGLMCLRPARRGGLSSIVSSVTLYNEMARRRPDLAAVLSEPVPFDRRGEVPAGEAPFFLNAVFNHHDGLVSSYVSRRYVESSQRHPDAPRLTPLHVEALDLLDALAEDPDLHLDMEFRAGRHPAPPQPHHLPRPHRVRGLAGAGAQAAPAPPLALPAERPAAPRALRGPVGERHHR